MVILLAATLNLDFIYLFFNISLLIFLLLGDIMYHEEHHIGRMLSFVHSSLF